MKLVKRIVLLILTVTLIGCSAANLVVDPYADLEITASIISIQILMGGRHQLLYIFSNLHHQRYLKVRTFSQYTKAMTKFWAPI